MIANAFEYAAPASLDEAFTLLDDGAKPLSGGMSLIPMMKLRLASPDKLVDLRRLPELNYIREQAGEIHIGATTTHDAIESSMLLRGKCPLLSETAANIGDIQVRNMGTIGGSVAHADPAADYPAALQALEAKIVLRSKQAERIVPVAEFFIDTFSTALEPGEIVTEIIVPIEAGLTGTSYQKLVQPASGFAIVGIAARFSRGHLVRVGVTGLSGASFRAKNVEDELMQSGDFAAACAKVSEGIEAISDLHASADYRAKMAQIYTARALRQAMGRSE